MTQYKVWSESKPAKDADPVTQLETTRTDRKIAENDADLIKTVLHKKVWIEEV